MDSLLEGRRFEPLVPPEEGTRFRTAPSRSPRPQIVSRQTYSDRRGTTGSNPVSKDKSIDTDVFTLLRKMKPMRQIEAVELMLAMNNHTARYAHALLAATRREDLAQPKKLHGLSAEQIARMEHEMAGCSASSKRSRRLTGTPCSIWSWRRAIFPASSAMPGSAAIWNTTTLKS